MPPRDYFEGTSDQVMAMFAEMGHASDRVAAVSSAAFLDDSLGAALAARFIKLGKAWQDRIFDGAQAPLGTFSAKIRLGYALALYGSITHGDLEIVRSIRNDFAHSAAPISFEDAHIAVKCRRLETPALATKQGAGLSISLPSDSPKRLYVFTAMHISTNLVGYFKASPPVRPTVPAIAFYELP